MMERLSVAASFKSKRQAVSLAHNTTSTQPLTQLERKAIATAEAKATRKAAMALQGEYIRHLRQAAGMTQWELANAMDLRGDGMVTHWESGRCWVATHHFARLAEVVGVEPTVLMFRLTVYRNLGLAKLAQRTPDQLLKHAQDSEALVQRVSRRKTLSRRTGPNDA